MGIFKLHSPFSPAGDQITAIKSLTDGINAGFRGQTLLGATGTGKTFTMANVIEKFDRPVLLLAHNKILAAQLCSELKEFFPENAVEYFVSYYDYYQPEAYIPSTDTFIEKDSAINDEIDKLRHSATASLATRPDTIVVSSVSCIYSLGSPDDYRTMMVSVRTGDIVKQKDLIRRLTDIQYTRNDISFTRGAFRVRGDTVEIYPAYSFDTAIRIEFFGDEIERISEITPLTGEVKCTVKHTAIFPSSHYIVPQEKIRKSVDEIIDEMTERVKFFEESGMLVEAQRIRQRTLYDIEMLESTGFCKGIENYSRVLAGREAGSIPLTLIDHFPKDFLLFIDESHVTVPQVRGMSAGDRARKETLINYGFRLPSAFDNRPLNFAEFEEKRPQTVFISATPQTFEHEHSQNIAEQIIRPTGLLDPPITVKPSAGQIEDILSEINETVERGQRVLITTLTKKMAEDLTEFLKQADVKVTYMHHDIDTIQRMEIVRDLRLGKYDVVVGINLLREGLDIPEVSLICILDADKEGFLRSATSLIQTVGRAARNENGRVIMYADVVTRSMEAAITETNRRREIQEAYNAEHGIVPKTIIKDVREIIEISTKEELADKGAKTRMSAKEKERTIAALEKQMKECAKLLEFEHAAAIRDRIEEIKNES